MAEVIEANSMSQLFEQLMSLEADARLSLLQQHSDKLLSFLRQEKSAKDPERDTIAQQLFRGTIQVIYGRSSPQLTPALLTLTNNLLSLNGICLNILLQSPLALKKIRAYCSNFLNGFIEETEKGTQIEVSQQCFRLYSVLYVLAVFASHRTTNQKEKKHIRILLSKSLLNKILLLELHAQHKPEVFYLTSIIMIYCCRPCFRGSFILALKKAILPQLAMLPTQHKLTFNYIYCLRTIVSEEGLTNLQVFKHGVIPFVMNSCRFPMHESQLIYSLDTIRMMMFGQAAIITKFLESGVLSILMSAYEKNRMLTTKIFEKVAMYITRDQCCALSYKFQEALRKHPEVEENVKCLAAMFGQLPAENLLEILQNGLINDIENMLSMPRLQGSVAFSAISILESALINCKNKLPNLTPLLLGKIFSCNILTKLHDTTQQIQQLVKRFIDRHYTVN